MMDERATNRYAQALFNLGEERGETEKTDQDLLTIENLIKAHPKVLSFTLNPTIALPEKERFLESILPDGISALTKQFIKLLVKKGRFVSLGHIRKQFHLLCRKKLGIQEVTAITAKPVSDEIIQKLHRLLTDKLKAKIKLIHQTNEAIVGGLILRFNGLEIDTSFRSRLLALKQILTNS